MTKQDKSDAASSTQPEYNKYRRTQIAEMADWQPGFDMRNVSVSNADASAGSPKLGDKIARNPANHDDRWLVAKAYFEANFEAAASPTEERPAESLPLENLSPIGELWAEYHNDKPENASLEMCHFAYYVHKRLAANTTTLAPCDSEEKSEMRRVMACSVQDHADKAKVVGGEPRPAESCPSCGSDERGVRGCTACFRRRAKPIIHGAAMDVCSDLWHGRKPTEEPELPEREPQWADCPRCRQKVLAPHECYESVLNEGEREAFEKYAESEGLMAKRYKGKVFSLSYVNGNTDAHWETWQAAYRAGAASNLEINDKSGWEYDPDAALRRVRARVATGKEK
jgi:hypothetical protein